MGFSELAILYVELKDKGFQVDMDLRQDRITVFLEDISFEIKEKEWEVKGCVDQGRKNRTVD